MNTVPGRAPNTDQIFHYYQELPKYLKGYHKCTKQDVIKLAALILRVRYYDNTLDVQNVLSQHGVKDIIPVDMVRAAPTNEWKKTIFTEYRNIQLSVEDARTAFLKTIYQWPTFGSTFFEVKQTTEPTYPEIILMAINRHGVNIIHPLTKVSDLLI